LDPSGTVLPRRLLVNPPSPFLLDDPRSTIHLFQGTTRRRFVVPHEHLPVLDPETVENALRGITITGLDADGSTIDQTSPRQSAFGLSMHPGGRFSKLP
jgi:hypothetical protein